MERPYFDASSQNACDTREWLGRLEFAINGNYAKLTKDAAVIRLADGASVGVAGCDNGSGHWVLHLAI